MVTKGEDEDAMNKYYEGPYFFQAKVMKELQPIYVELNHVFRHFAAGQVYVALSRCRTLEGILLTKVLG